jgi:hypothetical protein
MALHIAFEKDANSMVKKVVRTFAGPYVHTDIIVSQLKPTQVHTSYSSFMGENFTRIFQKDFWFREDTHDFIFIDVTQDELLKISQTCEACAQSKIQYNTRDMALCLVPFRCPRERTLFETRTLFCSQAVILILRSCLDPDHPLQSALNEINSRNTTPSQLHGVLKTVCLPVGFSFLK